MSTGGRYAVQYIYKMRKGVLCGDCHIPLPGVSLLYLNLWNVEMRSKVIDWHIWLNARNR
jgi:transposase